MFPNRGLFLVNYRKPPQAKSEIYHHVGEKIHWETIYSSYQKGPLPLIYKGYLETTKKKIVEKEKCP